MYKRHMEKEVISRKKERPNFQLVTELTKKERKRLFPRSSNVLFSFVALAVGSLPSINIQLEEFR